MNTDHWRTFGPLDMKGHRKRGNTHKCQRGKQVPFIVRTSNQHESCDVKTRNNFCPRRRIALHRFQNMFLTRKRSHRLNVCLVDKYISYSIKYPEELGLSYLRRRHLIQWRGYEYQRKLLSFMWFHNAIKTQRY